MNAMKWSAACAVMFGFFMGWAMEFDAVGLILVIAVASSVLMFSSGIGDGDAVAMKVGTLAVLGSLFVGALVGALFAPALEPGGDQLRIQAQQPHSRPR